MKNYIEAQVGTCMDIYVYIYIYISGEMKLDKVLVEAGHSGPLLHGLERSRGSRGHLSSHAM
jgi:hypothetical protein